MSPVTARFVRPAAAFHVYSVALALVLGTMVARSPLQPSDNFKFVALATRGHIPDLMRAHGQGKYRPAGLLVARAVTSVSKGHEAAGFRWMLGVQVAATGVLLGIALGVGTWYEMAVGTLALSVLFGHQAFGPTTLEGYPINHFGFVAFCCLLAVVLVRRPPAVWHDLAAPALALVAMLTLESGVLVVAVVGVGYLVGFRGVSRRGLVLVVLALVAYVGVRWWALPPDMRALPFGGHQSGYGFALLGEDQIRARFVTGMARAWWRVHNVAAAVLSVFLAEPHEGRWAFLDSLRRGEVSLAPAVNVVSSVATTILIVIAMPIARRPPAADARPRGDWRMPALAALMILANAALASEYIKNDILSTAAVFYALLAYAGARSVLATLAAGATRARLVTMTGALVVLSALWSLRVSDLACEIRYRAFVKRNDWATLDLSGSQYSADERELGARMRRAFINLDVPPPALVMKTLPCIIREP